VQNNSNWKKASRITESVVTKIREISKDEKKEGSVYFLNIPNEIAGAFVFRQGFDYALKLNKFDVKRFIMINCLSWDDIQKMNRKSLSELQNENLSLGDDIILKADSTGCRIIYYHGGVFQIHPDDHIFFWNLGQLEEIRPCIFKKSV
jgi:hypothetical protein